MLFPTVTGGIQAHSFLLTFCSVISLRACAETESRLLPGRYGGGLSGGYGEMVRLGRAAKNRSQSSGSVKFTGRLKSSTQFLGINSKDHKFNFQTFADGLDWLNWSKTK